MSLNYVYGCSYGLASLLSVFLYMATNNLILFEEIKNDDLGCVDVRKSL